MLKCIKKFLYMKDQYLLKMFLDYTFETFVFR